MKKILKILFMIFIVFSFTYLFAEARGGGGGGGGGSGGGDAVGGVIAMLIYAIYEIRRRKMIAKAKKDLEKALAGDSSWDLKELEKATTKIFLKYQEAWTNKDLGFVREYMTKSYYEKAKGIMEDKLHGRKNILEDVRINKLTLLSVRDFPGKDGDMFAMEVDANMIDYTINEKTGRFIESTLKQKDYESQKKYVKRAKKEGENFKEYYIFIRHNEKWLLNNIKQQFSIVGDIIKLKESELRKVLEKEKNTDEVNDDVFYTKGD